MTGDETRRFCGQCQKDVHNLSAMTEDEARGVVARPGVCVRYSVHPRTQTLRHRAPRRLAVRAVATAALTAGLALPAAAAISREPGEVGLLESTLQALLDWDTAADEVVAGGIELVPEREVEPVDATDEVPVVMGSMPLPPVEREQPVAKPTPEPTRMGRIRMPVDRK